MNHVQVEEVAENEPGVIYGEFLVDSVLASVLFDSGASHSEWCLYRYSRASHSGASHSRGQIPCHLAVISIPINLSGVVFLTDLVVLDSKGIDVILGMD